MCEIRKVPRKEKIGFQLIRKVNSSYDSEFVERLESDSQTNFGHNDAIFFWKQIVYYCLIAEPIAKKWL